MNKTTVLLGGYEITMEVNSIRDYSLHIRENVSEHGGYISIKPSDDGSELTAKLDVDDEATDSIKRKLRNTYDNDNIYGIIGLVNSTAKEFGFNVVDGEALKNIAFNLFRNVHDSTIVDMVEKHGFYIWAVSGGEASYAYTVGLRSKNLPDITIGTLIADKNTLYSIVKNLVDSWLTNGVKYGKISDIIKGYDVYVSDKDDSDKKWEEHLLGINRFYTINPQYDKLVEPSYPNVVQVYLPDENNLFQHENGFDNSFKQMAIV